MPSSVTSYPSLPAPPSGRFDGARHLFPLRIYFEDTDLSGVVYHANYLRYMERARSDMLRLAGIDQRGAMNAGQGAWAVTSLAMRYAAPARLDDELIVESHVLAVRGASVDIAQRVLRGDIVLTQAEVTAAFVSSEGCARRQPAGWAERFRTIMTGEFKPVDTPL